MYAPAGGNAGAAGGGTDAPPGVAGGAPVAKLSSGVR